MRVVAYHTAVGILLADEDMIFLSFAMQRIVRREVEQKEALPLAKRRPKPKFRTAIPGFKVISTHRSVTWIWSLKPHQ